MASYIVREYIEGYHVQISKCPNLIHIEDLKYFTFEFFLNLCAVLLNITLMISG